MAGSVVSGYGVGIVFRIVAFGVILVRMFGLLWAAVSWTAGRWVTCELLFI